MPIMPKTLSSWLVVGAMLCSLSCRAQFASSNSMQGERVDADTALNRALRSSSLTFDGKPFHAVMEIGTKGMEYSGSVEVWWIDKSKYRLVVNSTAFNQEMIVN